MRRGGSSGTGWPRAVKKLGFVAPLPLHEVPLAPKVRLLPERYGASADAYFNVLISPVGQIVSGEPSPASPVPWRNATMGFRYRVRRRAVTTGAGLLALGLLFAPCARTEVQRSRSHRPTRRHRSNT